MKAIHTQRLHALNLKISVFLILFFALSCTENSQKNSEGKIEIKPKTSYELISDYFKEQQNYKLTTGIKTVFVLSDDGCPPCNKHFSQLMIHHLNDSSAVFLIVASGTNIDLSEYTKAKSRVFYDKPENAKNILFNKSKAIFIKQQHIDTIINIDARGLDLQFEEMNQRLGLR